ncbi:hypothetical protein PFISCL1PPCAC_798, partial [Pristionchus fissidentatus]
VRMATRGSGKIEIREESSDESDAASTSSVEMENVERKGIVITRPLKCQTTTFQNHKKALLRKKKLVKRVTKKEASTKLVQKQNAMKLGLTKPDVVRDKVKERTLRKIATSGVAQLFNAVTERQKTLDTEILKHKGKVKKEKLSTTLNFGPPAVARPKKEEVEDWLNESHNEDDVKEEDMEE